MTRGQRACTAIAAGLVVVVGCWVAEALLRPEDDGGWFMYAPNSSVLFAGPDRSATLRTGGIAVLGIAIWLAIAWRLYRPRSDHESPSSGPA